MMKMKITTKSSLPVMVCTVIAFFLSGMTLSAQQFPSLVAEAEAQVLLLQEIPNLEATMENYAEGTPAYEAAKREYFLYVHTWEFVTSGEVLTQALTDAFQESTSSPAIDFEQALHNTKGTYDYGDPVFGSLLNYLSL